MDTTSLYKELGVEKTATDKEIRTAFRALALRVWPPAPLPARVRSRSVYRLQCAAMWCLGAGTGGVFPAPLCPF